MVPITLGFLDKTRYGLWAALSSVLAWFFIFDIGIGNGLRNKCTELMAKGDKTLLKKYVSTTYFIFSFLAALMILIYIIISQFIDWAVILKSPPEYGKELGTVVVWVFIVMCLHFVFKLVSTILIADLKNAISDSLTVFSHVITLIGIIILSKFTTPSIFKYAILYTGANLGVTIIASVYLYRTIYRDIAPSFKHIDLSLRKDLLNVGLKFFLIQIAVLILYQSTNLIISNQLGPDQVTDYSISMQYFSMATMLFTMLLNPLWSGYGDAYHRGDYAWINVTIKRLRYLWILLVIALFLMLAVQKPVFHIWLKDRVVIDYGLSLSFVAYNALRLYDSIYNPLINATGRLKLQMILILIFVPFFIPLSVGLVKYLGLGAKGVVLALIAITIPAVVYKPIQCKKILAGEKGIWTQ